MNGDLMEELEKYINGALNESERSDFEAKLQNDPELKEELDFKLSLRNVARAYEKDLLKDRLKQIQSQLPKTGETKFNWSYLAIAASLLLLVGIFFLTHKTFHERVDYAKLKKETSPFTAELKAANEIQVARKEIIITKIDKGKFGFANHPMEGSLVAYIKKPRIVDSSNTGVFYKFENDNLFIRATDSISELKVFKFNIARENEQKINEKGEMVYSEKPELKGLYIKLNGDFYKLNYDEGEYRGVERVVKYPLVERTLSHKMTIVQIVANSGNTRIDFINKADKIYTEEWVNISPGTFMRKSQAPEKLKLTKAQNIPLSPNKHFFRNQDDSLCFSLFFPAIPEDVDVIDILENENVLEDSTKIGNDNIHYFNFYNVHLNRTNYSDLRTNKVRRNIEIELLQYYSLK
jgi:LPXTG-motif cell wall-anchored protein